jgi:lysophospholipase L1-like esterase
MFTINDDLSIYATRGDTVFFTVTAEENGVPYYFEAGDVLRMKIFGKKDAESVVLEKCFPVTAKTDRFTILLTEEDTKIGDVISKPKDYWYEIELNPFTNPQTIIGYDEDGAKVFKLFPEGKDSEEPEIDPEDIPVVDVELDMTSNRPVQNQAISRAIVNLEAAYKVTKEEVAEKVNEFSEKEFDIKKEIAVERTRINNLIANPTSDDAELVDIRVGADGKVYGSAGEAVRQQNISATEVHKTTMQPIIGKSINAINTFEGYMQVGSKSVAVTKETGCGTTVYVFPVNQGIRYMVGYENICAFATDLAESGSLTDSVVVDGEFIAPADGYLYTYQALTPTVCVVDDYVILSGKQFNNPVKVTVEHEKFNQVSLIHRGESLFRDTGKTGVGCYCGSLDVGTYVAMGATYLVAQRFDMETATHIIKTIDTGATFEVATKTEYVSQTHPPVLLVEANVSNEQTILMLEDVTEQSHDLGDEVTGVESSFFGLFNSSGGKVNAPSGTRYNFKIFPVTEGKTYQLSCDAYSYPGSGYPLYGFFFVDNVDSGYAPYGLLSQKKTVSGSIQHTFTAPISGYVWVSHDSAVPSNLQLCLVNHTNCRLPIPTVKPYSKLLTVGDSLSGNKNLWQPKFIEIMGIPEYTNAGGSGGTIASGENSIYNRVYAIEGGDGVDLITLWGGFNDFNSSVELSTLEKQKDSATRDTSTFYGGLMACVEKLLTLYPTARLVLIGTTPFYWYESDKDWHDRTINGRKITDYVDAVKNVAEFYSLPFLDLLRTSGFNKFNYSIYFMDQGYYLHPNNVGNERLAHIIAGAVKAL